ncbi:reverse transcriptase domain-containing protein [Mesorhizobium australicum]|uniref:reverse transcriptase domain-containing protein n=1 Tax=Mesorhizobium australicum TaxID=536018 RepID=UPI00333DB991
MGDAPEAGGRRAPARHPAYPGSGGSDCRQAGAGTDIRGGLEDGTYGYRPRRSGTDAIKEVHRLICRGYTDVVDADLSKYFDTIPHSDLLKSVARRIVDRHVLRLIKLWLKAPIEERDGDGKRRLSGGKSSTRGTPQGGVASPLVSVIYMNRFLKHWRLTGRGEAYRAHVISYGDDFVILSRGHAEEALAWTRSVMTKLGLTLNEAKTSLKDARTESFEFLGYSFGPHRFRKDGHWYLGASPSKKSVQRIKTKIGDLLVTGNKEPWPVVCTQLNRLLRGGLPTSATEHVCRPIGRSTTTPMTVFALSSANDRRCKDAARNDSPTTISSGTSVCCVFDACIGSPPWASR